MFTFYGKRAGSGRGNGTPSAWKKNATLQAGISCRRKKLLPQREPEVQITARSVCALGEAPYKCLHPGRHISAAGIFIISFL